ncbi:MAG: flagellar basal body protein [Thermoguttaceae bacterium]|nr:flagellar basal body protein [Thermoguttaceae bacterium]MDW8077447.1 flagellar basal body protein [Thermoguttaceae bacterium]
MFERLFWATPIPTLEWVLRFTQARHHVLAGNIANIDTPGYQVRDLPVEEFRAYLQDFIARRQQGLPPSPAEGLSPGELAYLHHGHRLFSTTRSHPDRLMEARVVEPSPTVLFHDLTNCSLEHQVSEMVKNHLLHNTALAIMTAQLRLLQTAIAEHV